MNKQISNNMRGASIRAQKRVQDDAHKAVQVFLPPQQQTKTVASINRTDVLKVTFLGGLEDVGEKNMAVLEYGGSAIVLDCGNNLSVDLPGINYAINDLTYLESIKRKIKGYVITHGHLDHVGGLKHTVPKYPAPIYGSRYTMGVIEREFSEMPDFKPNLQTVDCDNHEKVIISDFSIEFIRVTHSLPDATAVCIGTPVGNVIATGDFRLDPEPLDKRPTDISRLQQLGDEGVLLLLSESSYADIEGRVPTESTLQQSFYDIIGSAEGRIFVAAFSSNMNRTQMIINAAVAAGRKVALDGRGMLAYAEIAVRQGILKVPIDTIVPISQAGNIAGDKLLVMCTGGQGEPNAAMQRMSEGQHRFVNLKEGDTVVISSSPIPGNEISYDRLRNKLTRQGVHLFTHPSHQIDGCGPLHVSGHARREELRDMIRYTRPKFFIPVHAGTHRRKYHAEIAIEEGIKRSNVKLPENGDSFYLTADTIEAGESTVASSLLVDQSGQVVSGVVVRDRLMLQQEGILTVIMTIDGKSSAMLTSPDIISRGFVEMRESVELMKDLRAEVKRAVSQRFKRVELDRFKTELRDFVAHFVYERTTRSPMVIVVVNRVGVEESNGRPELSKEDKVAYDQKRFAEMRARLLTQDQRD